jgi:subtilisin family serine protease
MNKRALLTVAAGVLLATSALAAPKPADSARYLIEYPAGNRAAIMSLIERSGGKVAFDYAMINGLAADLTPAQLRSLRTAGLATTIDADSYRSLHALPDFSVETVPWGVDRVEADAVWSNDASGGDPNVRPGSDVVAGHGVKVAVLDSGIDYGHPDLADSILDLRGDGKIRDFLDGDNDPTDSANNGHGSIVASVIASVDNDIGVIGVAPHAKIVPYRICNQVCPLSAIIGGLLQAIQDDVDVINMSFGGSPGFNLEASAIQAANRAGIVLVASAGNDASQKVQFPAGYDTVIAVGATDISDAPASFTNYGGWVDVTGPGVDIPAATCRGCALDTILDEVSPTSRRLDSALAMTGSAVSSVLGGEIVFVGRGCNVDAHATNPDGKVALIDRGACSFAEKVAKAEAAGAIGTVVANNVPGGFGGTLGDYTASGPSVSLSQEEGVLLKTDIAGGVTTVDMQIIPADYELANGTSFSGPHVAGVAALVKSANPNLSAIEVRKIIETTAEPIGHQVIFGAGMVRADRAVEAALAH